MGAAHIVSIPAGAKEGDDLVVRIDDSGNIAGVDLVAKDPAPAEGEPAPLEAAEDAAPAEAAEAPAAEAGPEA